jgi:predicted GNAT family acetyltransferase
MKKMKYREWDCEVKKGMYMNKNTVLRLYDETDGGVVGNVTVNLGNELPVDQAFIDDHDESKGTVDALMKAGIVKEIIGHRKSGFVTFPLCSLNLDGIDELSEYDR